MQGQQPNLSLRRKDHSGELYFALYKILIECPTHTKLTIGNINMARISADKDFIIFGGYKNLKIMI